MKKLDLIQMENTIGGECSIWATLSAVGAWTVFGIALVGTGGLAAPTVGLVVTSTIAAGKCLTDWK